MSNTLTGAWQVQDAFGYIEEATFGTTPTSPTFTNAGAIQELSETTDIVENKYRQLGNADIFKGIKTGELYSFSVKYAPINIALIKYGTEKDAGATGTVAKSLSLAYSITFNGTKNYIVFRGSKTDSIDVDITPEEINVTQNFICKSISVPNSAHGLGASTVFATANATTPQVGTDSASVSWNSTLYDSVSAKFTVNQNLEARRTISNQQIMYLTATNRDITFDFTILAYSTSLITDTQALTGRTLIIDVGTGSATFTNAYAANYQNTLSAEANNTWEQSYTGFAVSVAVA